MHDPVLCKKLGSTVYYSNIYSIHRRVLLWWCMHDPVLYKKLGSTVYYSNIYSIHWRVLLWWCMHDPVLYKKLGSTVYYSNIYSIHRRVLLLGLVVDLLPLSSQFSILNLIEKKSLKKIKKILGQNLQTFSIHFEATMEKEAYVAFPPQPKPKIQSESQVIFKSHIPI